MIGVFGGQGLEYREELAHVQSQENLPKVKQLLEPCFQLLHELCAKHGVPIESLASSSTPLPHHPILSFPLVGISQLAHYWLLCKEIGESPGEVCMRFKGIPPIGREL